MASYRRKAVEIDAVMEDFDSRTPESLRDTLAILDEVAKIGVEGYTKVTVTLSGRPEELLDLADELSTWTPSNGWSTEALRLFKALRGGDWTI